MRLFKFGNLCILIIAATGVISGCNNAQKESQDEYAFEPDTMDLFVEAISDGDFKQAATHSTIPLAQLQLLPVPIDPAAGHRYTIRGNGDKFPFKKGVFHVVPFVASNYEGATSFYITRVDGKEKIVAVSSSYITVPDDA